MGKTRDEYVELIREDIADDRILNKLIYKMEEFPEKAMSRALTKALDRYNGMTPPIPHVTIETFPFESLLIDMAILVLIEKAVFLRTRNNLTFSVDGITVDDQNWEEYLTLKKEWAATVRKDAKDNKKALNLKRGFGGVSSNYGSLW